MLQESIDSGFCLVEVLFDERGKAVDYVFLDVNPAFEAQTGLTGARGKRISELAPETEEEWFEIYGRIARTGQPERFEKRAAQWQRWYDVYAYRVGRPEDRQVAILFQEITDRKQAEGQLRRAREDLQATWDALPDLVFELDRERRIYAYHATQPELLYARPEDFLGKRMDDVIPAKAARVIRKAMTEAVRTGRHRGAVYSLRMPSGTGWFELSIAAKGDHRAADARFIVLGRDVTRQHRAERALRESEARYRKMVNAVPMLAWRCDAAGLITEVNERWVEYTGQRLAEARGTGWTEALHPDDRARALQHLNGGLNGGHVIAEGRVRRAADGQYRWHLARAVPIKDGKGKTVAWFGCAADIDDQKRAEATLRESGAEMKRIVAERTAELSRANARLTQRSSQLARLTAELVQAEQRERRRLADYLHDHLQQFLVAARMQAYTLSSSTPRRHQAAIEKLSRTLTEATEAARNVSQRIAPPVAVNSHLPEAFEWLVRDVERAHGLAVKARFQGELADVPEAESILLFTAARELLLNVVKHSGERHAELHLAREGDAVVLKVVDAGRGMAPAAKASPNPRGFGLFSIRERVELLGGGFTLESRPGRGVRVILRVPVPVPPRTDPEPRRAGKGAKASPHRRPKGRSGAVRRIAALFADDHRIVRESLARLLNAEPDIDIVAQCDNGQQAVEATGRLQPDVVVMDVSMPVMDGVEATRVIKARWPRIKVIGLSMFDEAHGGGQMRAAGADGYVSKSEPPAKLIDAVRQSGLATKGA